MASALGSVALFSQIWLIQLINNRAIRLRIGDKPSKNIISL
jgi:hypothetical protein